MTTIRLDWPQYRGGDPDGVMEFLPGLTRPEGRIAYGIGGQVAAMLAPDALEAVRIPVDPDGGDGSVVDGIVDKPEILRQQRLVLDTLRERDADRVVTIGGDCSVSVAPFAHLLERHGEDLAILWLDSHPDCNQPGADGNQGYNTMAAAHLLGHGDPEILDQLGIHVAAERFALVGTHSWADQDPTAALEEWKLNQISPAEETPFVIAVLDWLAATGCSKVAIHFDLDVITSGEVAFGMAPEAGGISLDTAVATAAAVAERCELVGLTISEFVSSEAVRLHSLLRRLPLLNP
ncbi:arginase [Brachybacterium vulturis]|uniref:Arginase n=1 Tax=Brachybacterium vulturis TaxID=2017484 RepID=A0A291GJA2_9MICO|nr:arginase family protein [Brachybacterium vulturis]ATG50429.1 arginase [Brachybacterium vulturis]